VQNAAGDGVALAPHDQNAAYRVVSDLVSLAEHVQNSLRLIEQMIASETPPETPLGSSESSISVIVLDDVCAPLAKSRCDRPQCIASSAFDDAPDFFLLCLPLRKRMSISVPLTRTSSQRR
jgi:hypothetical protein